MDHIYSQFIASLVGPREAADLKRQPFFKAILYLFVIVLIFGTISVVPVVIDFNVWVTNAQALFRDKAPDFTFDRGELKVQGKMPVIVDRDKTGIVIIDTSGKSDESALDQYESGVLITRDKMINKKSRLEVRTYNFEAIKDWKFTKSDVAKWLPLLRWFSAAIVFFALGGAFVFKLLDAFILALIGLLACRIMDFKLSFNDLYKFGIYYLTLPIILQTLLAVTGIEAPYFTLIYFLAALGYLIAAVNALKNPL
ncbi:MAG TPA: DUF1189 domain-containing protein [Candidatus Omnitrophota bacterium]|nr:DUF1189 domain-containing protein [Candidatus Omnitrophota bacterium]